MKTDEITKIFKDLNIDSATTKTTVELIPAIIHLLETDVASPHINSKIMQLRKSLNNFYKNIFSGWGAEKQLEFINSVRPLNLEDYKYVILSLILTDDSPWPKERLEYTLTEFRLLPKDTIFAYYKMLFVSKIKNKKIYFRRFAEQFSEDWTATQFENKISELEKQIKKTSNEAKTAVQNATINLVTVLGIFTAIISFIIITAGTVIKSEFAIPLMFIFAGILFLFVILLKFLSVYGDKPWHWLLVIFVCIFLMWVGLRTFSNLPIIPFLK